MNRKYTIEYVENKFNELGLELLTDKFSNCKEKLQFICPHHKENGIQNISFDKIINRDGGCKYCNIENRGKAKRIDDSIIIKKCNELNLNFISTFIQNKETWVKYTCSKHLNKGIISSAWYHIKTSKYGCPYCAGKYKTTNDFKTELQSILPNIEVVGEYINSETKIECRCRIDGNEWSAIPRGLLYGEGCPVCGIKIRSDKKRKSHETFVSQIKIINPNIIILSEYEGDKKLVKCKCLIDNFEWESYPSNLLNTSAGCPACAKKRLHDTQALTNEEFLNRLATINPSIEPLEEYYNYYVKLKCKCKIHNTIFYQTPHGMLTGKNGCKSCTQSKGEKILGNLLTELKLKVIPQFIFKDCKHKAPLRFDFYDPNNNIAYEYNGEQHYFPIDFAGKGNEWAYRQYRLNTLRDKIKENYCFNNNIKLIIVPYWEQLDMNNFLHNELVKHRVIEENKTA